MYRNLPRDVQQAITQFSTDFDTAFALGGVDMWAQEVGYVFDSDALRTTFPLPLGAAGYRLRDGDDKMRRLYERSFSMQTEEWTDGVHEKASIVEAADAFIGWSNEPANMAAEALRMPNVLAADLLARNPYLDFYRVENTGGSVASSRRLFANDHPYNVLRSSVGTFDNLWAAGDTKYGATVPATLNATLLKQVRQHFRSIKGPNGRPLGLRFAGFLVAADHEEEALDAFARDSVVELITASSVNVGGVAMPNRFIGTKVLVGDELTGTLPSGTTGDADHVYAFAVKAGGKAPAPFVVQRRGVPEEIRYDKDSELYKNTGLVGVKYVLQLGSGAALPHAILRIDLTP